MNRLIVFLFATCCLLGSLVYEVKAKETADEANTIFSPDLFEGLKFRSLGFSRGGRSTAVAGVPSQPLTYYLGSTGGGVWKTEDAGNRWKNVSDEFLKAGSIGAIAVAPSDPNVIYVGTGSACPRGNVSTGIGLYKSTDAGRSWHHSGLPEAGQIGRIRVHPRDENLVYVAALGHIFGPNEDRGVYRSKDGGATWQKVLYVSDRTGAVDISMDANNPRILYAAMWTAERKPWTLVSGGEGDGIFKSTDGGDNWERLKDGLPAGMLGKIGVTVSPANSDRVWAVVEAEKGKGVYRSDNAGKSWRLVSSDARLLQRPWYYHHIYADPRDENTVYVLNTGMYKSTDGGRSYQRIGTPHGDNHDLWISPENSKYMIEANDGGANVSLDGGSSWSSILNQPTAEFYRVTLDNQYPYRVYGAQQDNSTISVPSQPGRGVVEDWFDVGGCESGHIAVDPRNPDIVYAGCYGGNISRVNRRTGESRDILGYPQLQLGQAPRDLKFRFQWNAPIRISPHDPTVLYHASQVVHRSRDEGQSWEVISPDLTRNDKSKQDFTGGPISHDSTGVEVYGVIFSFEESPKTKGLLWAGSDDGLVHISRDNGGKWENITPPGLPEFSTVNTIELSAHDPGRAFVSAYRYRQDDFKPYVFRTNDYGKSWEPLADGTNGIPADHFVRVVREDPQRKGLLYAGTEFGMYISFDDGKHWQPFQLNLPVTPVTDLAVHRGDLVVATQGRAFWILDDLSPLHQLNAEVADSKAFLFKPGQSYRANFSRGVPIDYYFSEAPKEEVVLEILDSKGKVINTVKAKAAAEEGEEQDSEESGGFGQRAPKLTAKAGLNRFYWNQRYDRPEIPKGVIIWGGAPGIEVVPGEYQAQMKIGDWSQKQSFIVARDPRIATTDKELQEQFDLLMKMQATIDEVYSGLKKLRDVRDQVNSITKRLKDAGYSDQAITDQAKTITDKLKGIEEKITQVQSKSGQDALNYPPMLDNQLITLYGYVSDSDNRPPAGAYERFEDLQKEVKPLMDQLDQVLKTDLKAFNDMVRKKDVGPVIVAASDRTKP